jgi:aromatic ring-opening dioxygenase LigB subunit
MPLLQTFIVPHPPIILPEIGRGEEMKIQETIDAYETIARTIGELKPDTIILSSPHASYYAGHFHIAGGINGVGDFANFGAEEIAFSATYDRVLIDEIIKQADIKEIPAQSDDDGLDILDHGTMVPLYFINKEYQEYQLVRISLSELSPEEHYRYGQCIREAIDQSGKNVVYIASGDLSHVLKTDGPYGYAKEGPLFDKIVTKALSEGDFKTLINLDEKFSDKAAECGLRSFIIMAGVLGDDKIESELLSYEGTFGVGYAIATYRMDGD